MTGCPRGTSSRSVVTLAAAILAYMGSVAVPAYSQEFCIFTQITDITEGVAEPSMSAGGTRIVFSSHGDPLAPIPTTAGRSSFTTFPQQRSLRSPGQRKYQTEAL